MQVQGPKTTAKVAAPITETQQGRMTKVTKMAAKKNKEPRAAKYCPLARVMTGFARIAVKRRLNKQILTNILADLL